MSRTATARTISSIVSKQTNATTITVQELAAKLAKTTQEGTTLATKYQKIAAPEGSQIVKSMGFLEGSGIYNSLNGDKRKFMIYVGGSPSDNFLGLYRVAGTYDSFSAVLGGQITNFLSYLNQHANKADKPGFFWNAQRDLQESKHFLKKIASEPTTRIANPFAAGSPLELLQTAEELYRNVKFIYPDTSNGKGGGNGAILANKSLDEAERTKQAKLSGGVVMPSNIGGRQQQQQQASTPAYEIPMNAPSGQGQTGFASAPSGQVQQTFNPVVSESATNPAASPLTPSPFGPTASFGVNADGAMDVGGAQPMSPPQGDSNLFSTFN